MNSSKVGFLRKDTTHEAGGILNGPLLPTVVGFTEVRCGSKNLIDFSVLKVFMAVVVGDRSSRSLGIAGQRPGDGTTSVTWRMSLDLGDLCKTALALDKDVQRYRATAGDDEIILPVTELLTTGDMSRALAD